MINKSMEQNGFVFRIAEYEMETGEYKFSKIKQKMMNKLVKINLLINIKYYEN